jgi:chromosome segregation ATPase
MDSAKSQPPRPASPRPVSPRPVSPRPVSPVKRKAPMSTGPPAEPQPSDMQAGPQTSDDMQAGPRRLVMCLGIDRPDRPETPDLSDEEPPKPDYYEYRKDTARTKKQYANLPNLQEQLRLLKGYHRNRTLKELGRDLDRLRKMIDVLYEQHVFSRQDISNRFAYNRKFTDALLEEVEDDMTKFKSEIKAITEEIRMKIKASLTQVIEYMNKMRSESDLLAKTQFEAAQQLLKHNTQMGVIEHELSETITKIVKTERELNKIFATIRREMDLKDTKISSIELELAANDVKMAEKDAEMASIKRELAEIKSKNMELEKRFERLEQLYPHSS